MEKDIVCLLIHGFGGGPFELEALKNRLEEDNVTAVDVTLPGHMLDRKALGQCSYKDWIKAVDEAYQEIASGVKHQNIYIVGFSMGGLLGSYLASKYAVGCLVTLNTPIYYWDFRNIIGNLVADIKTGHTESVKRYMESSFKYPTYSLWNFRRLLGKTRKSFKEVSCPLLAVQTKDDDAVQYTSAEYIYNNVKTTDKKLIYMEDGGHGVLLGEHTDEAVNHIRNFILNHT